MIAPQFGILFLVLLLLWAPTSFAMCIAPYMRLVVIKPTSCKELTDYRNQVLAEWREELKGYPADIQAKEIEHIEAMLDHNHGIILHVQVLRERELWLEETAGKYVYRAGMWKEMNEPRDYYVQTSKHNACKQFPSEETVTRYASFSCCDVQPPDAIDCLLGMKVLWKLPKWSRQFVEVSKK